MEHEPAGIILDTSSFQNLIISMWAMALSPYGMIIVSHNLYDHDRRCGLGGHRHGHNQSVHAGLLFLLYTCPLSRISLLLGLADITTSMTCIVLEAAVLMYSMRLKKSDC